MEIRFITTETVSKTPKKITEQLNYLKGKLQGLLDNYSLLESFNIK